MAVCIQRIFTRLEELDLMDKTLIIVTSDHGESLMDHECYFDHHGLYECIIYQLLDVTFGEQLLWELVHLRLTSRL